MRILINASTCKTGGALQVAHSVIANLYKYPQHHFIVLIREDFVLPKNIEGNIIIIRYSTPKTLISLFTGYNNYLNRVVSEHHVERVFTIFGPSYWRPKVKHICGFAYPHYVYRDSPFFDTLSIFQKIKLGIKLALIRFSFKNTSDVYITENQDVSNKLIYRFNVQEVHTVSNNYNQIFDNIDLWDKSLNLPKFQGTTFLTIAYNYPHKNLYIIPQVINLLRKNYPDFKFRFVITISPSEVYEFRKYEEILCIGPTKVEQNPFLYEQSDVMFLPTLLECFSASYPEAMKMGVPIATSDLGFAKGLCKDAAVYFDPTNPKDIAEKLYNISTCLELRKLIVARSIDVLREYDTSDKRTDKYIEILTKE